MPILGIIASGISGNLGLQQASLLITLSLLVVAEVVALLLMLLVVEVLVAYALL
jgi:hypothetical protein